MKYTSKFSGEEIDSILENVGGKQDAIPDLETIRSNAKNASDIIARMVESGYLFAGVATIDTNPGIPDAKVFYIANGKGTYTNFGGLEVTEDEVVVLYWDTAWHKVATGIASQAKLSELESEISVLENAGYMFAGVATPETNPGTPKQKVFYISSPGKYPNFIAANIPMNHIGIFKYDTNWDISTIKVVRDIHGNDISDLPTSIGYGLLQANGQINTTVLPSNKIFKFDIPDGVSSVDISCYSKFSPEAREEWCIAWMVDANGNMLSYLRVTEYPQILDNFPMEVPNGATQVWVDIVTDLQVRFAIPIQNYVYILAEKIKEIEQKIGNDLGYSNQWKGKKIVWMGTSIPYGQSAADGGRAPHPYPSQIAEKLGCTILNNAVQGLAIEGNYINDVWVPKTYGSASLTIEEYAAAGQTNPGNKSFENNMLGHNADLYVFDVEPNNVNASLDDLQNFDVVNWHYNDNSAFSTHRSTFVGALLYLLDKLWTEKPDAKVVFIGEYGNATNYETYAIRTACIALAEKLRIPYINVWSKLYYNQQNKLQYLNTDLVHPTQAGYDRIAKILTNELLLIA